jgi:hypothetical protein
MKSTTRNSVSSYGLTVKYVKLTVLQLFAILIGIYV